MRQRTKNLVQRWLAAVRARQPGRRGERGMNLLEIMVVLVIISLIAGTVSVAVLNRLDEAKRKTAGVQIHNIAEALELYKLTFHNYPSTAEGLPALVSPKGNAQPFMPQIPKDPWNNEYVYIYPGTSSQGGFDIISYGPDGVQGGGDDITNSVATETARQ